MTGIHRLSHGTVGGDVGARAIEDVDAFGIALEFTLNFERATVGQIVDQARRETRARPRTITLFFTAPEPVERGEQRRSECGFAGFVRAVDHVEVRVERNGLVLELSETVDMEFA